MKPSYTIGVDIGGTKMAAVLWNGKRVVADSVLATPRESLGSFLSMFTALIDPLEERARKDKADIAGIGLGIPAMLDTKRETILDAPNLRIIEGKKLLRAISEKRQYPIAMDNDASCFIRGEATLGAGRKFANIFGVTLGTGIGGGWWINGDSYQTSHGGACEISRMIVDFSAGINLEEFYHRLTQNNPAGIAEDAYRGDPLAQKTFEELGRYIGIALANIGNLLSPDCIVIGGSVVNSGDLFWSAISKSLHEYLISPEVNKKIKLVRSALGKDAGAIGAALLTMRSS